VGSKAHLLITRKTSMRIKPNCFISQSISKRQKQTDVCDNVSKLIKLMAGRLSAENFGNLQMGNDYRLRMEPVALPTFFFFSFSLGLTIHACLCLCV
jgi:hypothetical protein